jgi:hypothetical protein
MLQCWQRLAMAFGCSLSKYAYPYEAQARPAILSGSHLEPAPHSVPEKAPTFPQAAGSCRQDPTPRVKRPMGKRPNCRLSLSTVPFLPVGLDSLLSYVQNKVDQHQIGSP